MYHLVQSSADSPKAREHILAELLYMHPSGMKALGHIFVWCPVELSDSCD